MNATDSIIGFYGKLPSHGDFISRRLPRQFIEPWDQWLQGSLTASREQLGADWLKVFLVSPIWQFALTPGLCSDEAWAGVMMPSVDRVGRYFPLTLAAKLPADQLQELFDPRCSWFEALSQLAFSSLDYDFDLQNFDTSLQNLQPANFMSHPVQSNLPGIAGQTAKLAFRFDLPSDQDTPQAWADLAEMLKNRYLLHCSYWRASGDSEGALSSLIVCEGLPPIDAYVGFLNGQWPQHGWQLIRHGVEKAYAASSVLNGTQSTPDETINGLENLGSFSDETVQPFETIESIPDSQPTEAYPGIQSYGLSVVGLKRKLNEDAILQRSEVGMWVVADGMGGHSAGDVASQSLVSALAQIPFTHDLEYFSEQVASSLHTVNRQLLQMAKNRGSGQIIGSTIVILLISDGQFRYLWAGDSRLYLYRQGLLKQLTQDHSLYNESISQGLPPADGNLEQGRGNIITRAVGADSQLQLDYGQGDVAPGDMFILSSDGLDKELSHADIAEICSSGSAETITRNLIQEAENRGGRDNISVIVVRA